MKFNALSAVLMALAPLAWSAPLPEPIRHLETITDEADAVDAMRDYSVMQDALIQWDSELARQYTDGGESALATAKAEDIRNRLAVLAAGWSYLLERYPSNARVNNYYGEYLYDHTRDQAGGVRFWQQAIALEPAFGPAHNNLGVHYLHTGGVQMGLQHLHTAIELDPNHPDYLFNITQAYFNQRREVMRWYKLDLKGVYAAAMKFSKRAAELDPSDLDLVQDYAVNFFAAPDFDVKPDWNGAIAAWDAVLLITQSPVQRHFALLNKARVYVRMSKWQDAAAVLEESLALQPDSEAATNLLAQCRAELDGGGKKKKDEQTGVSRI